MSSESVTQQTTETVRLESNDIGANLRNADKLLNVLMTNPDFKVTWNNRRRVVSWTLVFCASMIALITIVCCVTLFLDRDLQANVTSIFITIISAAVFLATTIIGSYVFGAMFETTKFRDKITDLAGTIITGKRGA